MCAPELDGKTHINIHPKAATWLGKFLAHRTLCELNMPEGRFLCIEAYWYYLTTKDEDSRLFHVYGWETELLGTQLISLPKKHTLPTAELQQKIKKALDQKLKWSEYWQEEFTDSTLPFTQSDDSRKFKWLLAHLESRRELLKNRRNVSWKYTSSFSPSFSTKDSYDKWQISGCRWSWIPIHLGGWKDFRSDSWCNNIQNKKTNAKFSKYYFIQGEQPDDQK